MAAILRWATEWGVDDQLIGREREQARLQAWAAEALAGRGPLVLLAGEAGVGKTSLARRRPWPAPASRCSRASGPRAAPAFGPVVEVLRVHLRPRGAGRWSRGRWPPTWPCCCPSWARRPPRATRATLFEAIHLALAAIATRGPAALFLEDLQWADDATLELLAALARSLDTQPPAGPGGLPQRRAAETTQSGACAASCAAPAGCGSSPSSPWGPRPPPPCWSGP